MMGGVVGGDGVDRTVGERFDDGIDIGLAAYRRTHLGIGVEASHRLVGEREVVWCYLAGDVDTARFGVADQAQGPSAGDVSTVQLTAGELGEN